MDAAARWLSWSLLGVAGGAAACLRLAQVNDSLRGESGLVFVAWWCAIYAVVALAVPIAQRVAARRLARDEAQRADAGSVARGLLVLAASLGVVLATGGVESGAVRWALRALAFASLLALAVRIPLRVPRGLDRSLAALALCAAVALPWAAARQVRANVPPVIEGPAAGRSRPRAPLLVIGLDGLEWTRLRDGIARGALPAFSRLVRHAAVAPLRTSQPTWSPIIWTTIATGLDELGHGVRDFSEFRMPGMDCGVMRLRKRPLLIPRGVGLTALIPLAYSAGLLSEVPVTGCHRRAPAFWDDFSEAGGRVAVLGWYATWPAYPVRGVMVSDNNPARAAFQSTEFTGHLAAQAITYPPELLARLAALPLSPSLRDDALTLAGPIFAELPEPERQALAGTGSLEMFRVIQTTDEFTFRSAGQLLAEGRPELLAMYATGIDNVSHRMGKLPGVVDHYYEYVDARLGELLAVAPADAYILVVSDHGWSYADGDFGHSSAPDGVFILAGPAVHAGRLPASPHVRDVTPTALALLGLPAAEGLAGEAVWTALPASVAAAAHARGAHRYASLTGRAPPEAAAPALQEETMERLRALGYVQE